MRLILASKSPARLTTLRRAGVMPEVIVSDVDEDAIPITDTRALALELARLKAEAVAERLSPSEDVIVVGCDTVLDFDGKPRGKPGTPEAAERLWRRLRRTSAALTTGHNVIVRVGGDERVASRVAETIVHFADLSDEEIAAYAATGEPEKVAGGFTIDGMGGPFITGIEGDHHNVVGISLPLLRMMLADLGIPWHTLWASGGALTRLEPVEAD